MFILVMIIATGLCFAGGSKDKGGNEPKEITVYVAHNADQYNAAIKKFEALTGIEVMAVSMGTGDCLQRIAAESARPLCDVMWGGTTESLEAYKKYFQPYTSAEDANIPAEFKAKDKLWIGESQQPAVIMYNKNLVQGSDIPVEWADLLNPKWKGKIVMASPQKSGSAYAQAYGIYKLYGWEGLTKLINNANILDSSSLVYKGTAEGEFAVGITMEYAAYRYVAGGSDAVKIVYPADGVISAPEGAAIVAGAKREKEAKAFFDYLISKDVVSEIYAKYYRRPARRDATKVEGLPGMNDIVIMKDFDPEEANKLEKELLAKWRELVLNKK